jgi:hypothetical protein
MVISTAASGRSASLHVRRVKNGKPSVHPLRGDEIKALRELRRLYPDSGFTRAYEKGETKGFMKILCGWR